MNANSPTAIWEQAIDFEPSTLTPEAARALLALDFRESAQDRIRELAEKNQEGTISVSERRELETFVLMDDLLTLLQSRARLYLRDAGVSV